LIKDTKAGLAFKLNPLPASAAAFVV